MTLEIPLHTCSEARVFTPAKTIDLAVIWRESMRRKLNTTMSGQSRHVEEHTRDCFVSVQTEYQKKPSVARFN